MYYLRYKGLVRLDEVCSGVWSWVYSQQRGRDDVFAEVSSSLDVLF